MHLPLRLPCACIVGLLALAPATARVAPTVEEIVQRHVEARGGYDKIRTVHTLVYSEGLYREGDYKGSGNAMMAFGRPYFRIVGNPAKPGGYMEGYDGAAWEWFADPGIVIRTVGAASGATRRGADFEGMLIDYREKGSTVELREPGELDGKPVHRLLVTLRDGFQRELWIDPESHLVVAEKRTAPIHAYGDPVTSLTRIEDYRSVAGVLFPYRYVEAEIATGKPLSSMQWGKVEVNRELDPAWFSPPAFTRTVYQRFLEHLYVQRTDSAAVMWSYAVFRRAHPEIDTHEGVELIGYQMLKMGEVEQAVVLLEANAQDHAQSASGAFGLGRAYRAAGREDDARAEFQRALELDPGYRKAAEALQTP